ncbi:MAG: hypothetical protein IPK97_05510 [Ahniella sp.]|nr:hypothetical protein [Ahniella sp.]
MHQRRHLNVTELGHCGWTKTPEFGRRILEFPGQQTGRLQKDGRQIFIGTNDTPRKKISGCIELMALLANSAPHGDIVDLIRGHVAVFAVDRSLDERVAESASL